MTDREPFAARWNRRKLEAKQGAVLPVPVPEATLPLEAAAVDETPLPSLDDITPEGDIAEFLHKRIPAELQKLALRKAWTSDPVISGFIEIAENQYDWNTPGGCPGYGPLDPSWNVEKLLAQATGALPPEEAVVVVAQAEGGAAGEGECGAMPQPQAQVAGAPAHKLDDAAPNKATTDDVDAREAVSDGSSEQMIPGHYPATVKAPLVDMSQETQRLAAHKTETIARRRHGGALPIL